MRMRRVKPNFEIEVCAKLTDSECQCGKMGCSIQDAESVFRDFERLSAHESNYKVRPKLWLDDDKTYELLRKLLARKELHEYKWFKRACEKTLCSACRKGRIRIVRLFLEEYKDFIDHRLDRNRPLGWALGSGNKELVQLFFDKGCLTIRDLYAEKVVGPEIYHCAQHGHYDVLEYLFQTFDLDITRFRAYFRWSIAEAARRGDQRMIELFICHKQFQEVDLRDDMNRPITEAVDNEKWDMVQYLMKQFRNKEGVCMYSQELVDGMCETLKNRPTEKYRDDNELISRAIVAHYLGFLRKSDQMEWSLESLLKMNRDISDESRQYIRRILNLES